MNFNCTNIPSRYSLSHHVYPGYIEFTDPAVQRIWEEKFLPSFTPFLPSHIDLVVGIVDDYDSKGKTLRLLAIYNAKENEFDCSDKTLKLYGFFSGFFLDCLPKNEALLFSHIS